jgi:endonuclease/exonuclease/phosphatase family metal-dependent hydrolase
LRLLTYNTHSCRGVDGLEDPARILDVIREADADIVALQEVDQRSAADQDFLDRLQSMDDYAIVFDPTLTRPQGGAFGNALLSRWPIRSSVRLDLSVRTREPRGAIRAEVETPCGLISATATHLGLRPAERREQVNRLLSLPKTENAHAQVLLGDFNEWWLWGRPLRRLHRHYGAAPSIRSFPSRWPIFHLDRIWVRPRHRLRFISTLRTPRSRVASDHLPVIAELE